PVKLADCPALRGFTDAISVQCLPQASCPISLRGPPWSGRAGSFQTGPCARLRTSLQGPATGRPYSKLKKIAKQLLAVLGHNGLWMELHSLNRKLLVAQAHDDSIRSGGGHFQTIRARLLVDDQGMIPGRLKSIGQPLKNGPRVVADLRCLAMH